MDESIRIMRNRKKDFPEAANVRLKTISRVFKWALEEISAHERKRYGITGNPARDVARLKPKNPGGTIRGRSRKLRLTRSATRSAPRRISPCSSTSTAAAGAATWWRSASSTRATADCGTPRTKNSRRNPVVVDIAMPADLQRVLDASRAAGITGDLTFLMNQYGRAFTAAGFGNKFRDWCIQAKVPGRGHGLRKAAAVRVAENRGTVDELKAIFGRRSNRQPELYVAQANRRRLGNSAPDLLARPKG